MKGCAYLVPNFFVMRDRELPLAIPSSRGRMLRTSAVKPSICSEIITARDARVTSFLSSFASLTSSSPFFASCFSSSSLPSLLLLVRLSVVS